MKNIVRLARIIDNFIELDSSFVLVEDIRAIRKVDRPSIEPEHGAHGGSAAIKGIEVVTPHGTFYDSTEFESFKTRIDDTLAALKEKTMEPVLEEKPKGTVVQLDSGQRAGRVEQPNPQMENPPAPVQNREVTVVLNKNGSTGTLFDDSELKVVNRSGIRILAPDGSQVASGTDGGTIMGDVISGIVYESGRYTFAAKEYPGNKIVVNFQVRRR